MRRHGTQPAISTVGAVVRRISVGRKPTARGSLPKTGKVPANLPIAALAFYGITPSLFDLALNGRSISRTGQTFATVTGSELGRVTAFGSSYLILCGLLILLGRRVSESGQLPIRLRGASLYWLLSWCSFIFVKIVALGYSFSLTDLFFPLFLIVFMAISPTELKNHLARTTTVIAVLSLAAGLTTSFGTMGNWGHGETKALIGSSALSGIFVHANVLGLALALGLPFILAWDERSLIKASGCAATILALAWSGSRTSLIAAGIVLTLWLISKALVVDYRPLYIILALISTLYILFLPFRTESISAFSGRGAVWQAVKQTVPSVSLYGFGPDAFSRVDPLTRQLGYFSSHGHNLIMTGLGRGGVILALFLALAVIVTTFTLMRGSAPPYAWHFWIALTVSGTTENVLDITSPSALSWVTWAGLAVLIGNLPATARVCELDHTIKFRG